MSHISEFDFNAPKYHDFNSAVDDKEVDSFFDTDHEVPPSASKDEKYLMPNLDVKPDVKHLMEQNNIINPLIDNIKTEDNRSFKQSSTPRLVRKAHRRCSSINSTSSIPSNNMEDMLNQGVECLSVTPEKKRKLFEGISINVHTEKQHRMTTRHDQISNIPMLDLRTRSVVRNNKRGGSPIINHPQSKYMGMAERIFHFERDTPPRFHSRRLSNKYKTNQNIKSQKTIAHTPNLIAVNRNRPITALSLQMKEEMEVEAMKKHQIKALPLNKEMFKEPSIPLKPESKPVTKQYPFKLTTVLKKPVVEEKPFHFTARAVPKTVFETPTVRPLREKVIKIPVLDDKGTSYIIKQKEIGLQGIKSFTNNKRCTEPQPFSFEERNKQMFKKKEEKIKEYLDEEKKAREFHANPLPVFVTSKGKENSTIIPTVPATPRFKIQERIQQRHQRDNNKSMEEACKPFKARSPSVLHKKPFEPKKPERPLLDVIEIELNTERRAREREVFDLTVKEREQMLECLKREREMELKKKEEEEIARLRKDITHKAIPVPSFKPLVIKKSEKPLTDPYSPFFTHRSKTSSNDNI